MKSVIAIFAAIVCLPVVISKAKCFECIDGPPLTDILGPDLEKLVHKYGAALAKCSSVDFEKRTSDSKEGRCEITPQSPGYAGQDGGCAKVTSGETTLRFCVPTDMPAKCEDQANATATVCYCDSQYCNGAEHIVPRMAALAGVMVVVLAVLK